MRNFLKYNYIRFFLFSNEIKIFYVMINNFIFSVSVKLLLKLNLSNIYDEISFNFLRANFSIGELNISKLDLSLSGTYPLTLYIFLSNKISEIFLITCFSRSMLAVQYTGVQFFNLSFSAKFMKKILT